LGLQGRCVDPRRSRCSGQGFGSSICGRIAESWIARQQRNPGYCYSALPPRRSP